MHCTVLHQRFTLESQTTQTEHMVAMGNTAIANQHCDACVPFRLVQANPPTHRTVQVSERDIVQPEFLTPLIEVGSVGITLPMELY